MILEMFFPYGEYIYAGLIIALAFIGAKFISIFFKKVLMKFAEKTDTDLDNVLIKIIATPIELLIILLGLYKGFKVIPSLQLHGLFINRVFFVFIIVVAGVLLARLTDIIVDRWLVEHRRLKKVPLLINKIINITIYILVFLTILIYFKIEVTPIITALGVGGIAIGLALQNTLSNFFAGLHLLSDHPIRVGDFIELENNNLKGYVEDIGWRSTRIRKLTNTIIIMPNNKLAESVIVNESLPQQELSISVPMGVAYTSNLDKVEKITIGVAKEIQKKIDGAVEDFEPIIRYKDFGESNINFIVILRVMHPVAKYLVKHEFIKAIHKSYKKNKIEISWPVRKIVKG